MAPPVGKGSAWAGRAAEILFMELLADHDLLRISSGRQLPITLTPAWRSMTVKIEALDETIVLGIASM